MKNTKKSLLLLVSVALILVMAIGGTLAYIVADSGPVKNTFTPSQVTTYVEEDVTTELGTKKNVKIKNTGDTDAWIRAAVVVTWQDATGNVYGQAPQADKDYTDWTPGNNWVTGDDGFYYYTKPVAANTSTADALIAAIKPIGNPPADGYYLTVEILGSGIQSVPADVFNIEWASSGLTVNDDDADPMQWTLVSK